MKTIRASALVLLAYLTFSPVVTDAATVTKEFEVGAGTTYTGSARRDFWVPCGLDVNASVKFERKGPAAKSSDIPIVIELRAPAASPGGEQPMAAYKDVIATVNQQTTTMSGDAINRGCNVPWSVRVRPKAGTTQYAVLGSITLSWNDNQRNISIEGNQITLNEGNSFTKNLGPSSGLPQGKLRITAQWGNIAYPATQMGKVKIEIINPQGQVVASQTGHPTSGPLSPRIDLNYNIPSCMTGQWKIRFTNNTDIKISEMVPTAKLTPDCP